MALWLLGSTTVVSGCRRVSSLCSQGSEGEGTAGWSEARCSGHWCVHLAVPRRAKSVWWSHDAVSRPGTDAIFATFVAFLVICPHQRELDHKVKDQGRITACRWGEAEVFILADGIFWKNVCKLELEKYWSRKWHANFLFVKAIYQWVMSNRGALELTMDKVLRFF